jgi:uncharacterized membrane protein YobD (UPF0266 family)
MNKETEAHAMNATTVILLILLIGYGGFLLFDALILPFIGGKTLMTVRLRKKNYVDQLILAGIVVIAYIVDYQRGGSPGSVDLLLILFGLVLLYSVFIYSPKARFKGNGFYYGIVYTPYDHVKNMRLSKDGVLVVDTDKRRLLLYAKKIEDLEKILNTFLEH